MQATSDKSASGSGIKNENMSNQELAKELHKQIIRNFEKRKLHLSYIDNADHVDMQLISKFGKGIRFLLFIIVLFST